MFNEKEILNIVDILDLSEDDYDNIDIELNDIEKKRIRKKYKKNILYKRTNYLKTALVACGLVVVIYTGSIVAIPVNASNVPIVNSIYETIGVYEEYKDYSTYVGESKSTDKYRYTIEEITVSPHKSIVAIKIESGHGIPENHEGFMVSTKIGGVSWDSSTSRNYRVDNNTIITTVEHFYFDKIPNKSDINIIIHSIDSEDYNNSTTAQFDLKSDFQKCYNEYFEKQLNKVLYSKNRVFLIDEINSSIFGTNIVSKAVSLENTNNSLNNNFYYVLNVDNIEYNAETTNGSSEKNFILSKESYVAEIKDLKIDQLENAKSISLLIYESNENNLQDDKQNMILLKEYKIK